jgi:predicted methyltransferase
VSRNVLSSLVLLVVLGLLAAAPASVAQMSDPLADPRRTDDDRARDPNSKPLEVYAFFGIEPGMTVVDLMPGGGYNTHILSNMMGDSGMLYAGPDRRGGLTGRIESAGLDNVTVISGIGDIPEGTVDVILTVRNVHDLELNMDTGPVYAAYLAALKPGGIFGVVDARTPNEGADDSTHRINQDYVIEHVTAAGFELVDTSEMLANPNDDYTKWEGQGERTQVDRMVLKFRKPGM